MATLSIQINHFAIQIVETSVNGILRYDAAYITKLDKDIFGKNKYSYCVCVGYKGNDIIAVEEAALANSALVFDSAEAAHNAAFAAVQALVASCDAVCDAIVATFTGSGYACEWTLEDEFNATEIAANYDYADAAAQVEAENIAAAAAPTYVNVEVDKRMQLKPAEIFDMQALAAFARCMPINAPFAAKNGDIYFLWGAAEFPAYMDADGCAEIWRIPNSRPCLWLSVSLGSAPRPAFVVENYDDDGQHADFWREEPLPF